MEKAEDSKEQEEKTLKNKEGKSNIEKEGSDQKKEQDEDQYDKENKTKSVMDEQQQQQNTQSNNKIINPNNNINTSTPTNANENPRNQKKIAMNRMRNSIKDTLFKSITKKVNPEGSNTNDQSQGSSHQIEQQQLFNSSIEKGQNNNEDQFNQKNPLISNNEDQSRQDNENFFKLQNNLTNSVKMEQVPRIEFNFTNNGSNKFRAIDPIITKILEGGILQKFYINKSLLFNRDKEPAQIINQTRIFEEKYELLNDKLGEGCHGDVRKCIKKDNKQVCAVKMIRNGDTEIILSAITSFKIAKNLNHPSIIKPYELFINRETEKIYYVMEYCEYGSLQDYIENFWNLSPHKRQKKQRAISIEYNDEEYNTLDNFDDVSSKAIKKQERRKKKSGDKRSSDKKTQKQNSNENQQFIKLQQQFGESDNLSQNSPKKSDNQLNDNNEADDQKQNNFFDTLNGKQEDQQSPNKFEKKKVQFQQQTGQKLEQNAIKKVIKEILIAVDYLHSEGICHRDLKPDNILVSNDLSTVKIIDFEISKQFKFFRQNRSILKVCEMWTRTGTQDFMSPEMFESTGYGEAVDIWAIGVIAYLLFTGRLPFDQEYISDKIESIRNAQYNLECMKDIDEVPKDFIRRMLKKDPNERLTASEALSHPWFLVSSNNESRNRLDYLNKSTFLHLFHSPQDSDKTSNIDSSKYKELNLMKNQSTILHKKDNKGYNKQSKYKHNIPHLNTQISQRITQSKNYSLSNHNQSKARNNKIQNDSDQNRNEGQDIETPDINVISESSTMIQEKKRSNKSHATEIGQMHGGKKNNFRQDNNGDKQTVKQSYFYNESKQNNMTASSNNGELSFSEHPIDNFQVEYQNGFIQNSSKHEDIPNQFDQIYSKENQEERYDQDELQKRKEFQDKIQEFKNYMQSGSIDFIFINQKQQKHPPISQLRLRLLQEKALQKSTSIDKNSLNQITQSQSNENKNELCKASSSGVHISNNNNTTSSAHISIGNTFNSINPLNQNNQNGATNLSINSTNLNYPNQTASNSETNTNTSSSLFPLTSSIYTTTHSQSITNNNNNNNINQGNSHTNQFPFEPIKLSPLPSQSFQHSQQQILTPQNIIENSELELQSIRSRSNTNDLQEKMESEDQIETRAKRLSEDFTSSSSIQIPQRQHQIQNILQQSINQSQKNGTNNDGKVQKSSHFSSNPNQIYSNVSSSNVILSNSNFSISSQKQLSLQEQLQLKPIKHVREFLLTSGVIKHNNQIDEELESSINPIFKNINNYDESPHSGQNDFQFKKVDSQNSSNKGNSLVNREIKSNSDVCSIASERHISIDQKKQQDQIEDDQVIQPSDIIKSSSEESFQAYEDDDNDF